MSVAIDTPSREALQPVAAQDVHKHHLCYGNSRQGWIVVCSHSQAERWANSNLQRRGYRTYLPLMTVRQRDRVIRSQYHTVQRPLFSGYLFCWYNSRDPRRPIRETPGVRDVIRCGSEIQWASNGAVDALQALDAQRAVYHRPEAEWPPGTPCAVSGGVFDGHPAVVLQTGSEMALVSILMFGALREVAVQLNCLMPRDE